MTRRHPLMLVPVLLFAGCPLLGIGATPCETDTNCPSGQICGADKTCVGGARDAQVTGDAAVDAAQVDGATTDGAASDASTTPDAGPLDTATADTAVASDAAADAGSVDAHGPDAMSADATASGDAGADAGSRCENPPCVLMPDSPTLVCRDSDTTLASCSTLASDMDGQDGNLLWPAPSYLDLTNGVIDDRISGLQWEQALGSASLRNVSDAITYCAGLSLGSQDDWRLPSFTELMTLLDLGKTYPAAMLDTLMFPAPDNLPFWSASGYNGYHWTLDFYSGTPHIDIDSLGYGSGNQVRCVRGAAHVGGDVRFTAGTYIDKRTGMQWQAQPGVDRTWQQAAADCETLSLASHDDWRLPTLKEMDTLVDRSRDPGSDPFAYPAMVNDTASAEFWTATPHLSDYGFYAVLFQSAQYTNRYRSSTKRVRCVRGP
ncbi:MAG: DUF1566 domain-containing protein [Pseudomonadota bacterium]